MNIAVIIILVLLLGAKGGTSPTAPDAGSGCKGCCPGTSTYDGMIKARALLQTKYGSWSETPLFAQLGHTLGYGQCPGYNDF
jgi:hypothetical protein